MNVHKDSVFVLVNILTNPGAHFIGPVFAYYFL